MFQMFLEIAQSASRVQTNPWTCLEGWSERHCACGVRSTRGAEVVEEELVAVDGTVVKRKRKKRKKKAEGEEDGEDVVRRRLQRTDTSYSSNGSPMRHWDNLLDMVLVESELHKL